MTECGYPRSSGGMRAKRLPPPLPGLARAGSTGTGPGFGNEKGRLGWNRTAGKLASKYEERGLEALVGSDTVSGSLLPLLHGGAPAHT